MWRSLEQCFDANFKGSKGKKKHFLFSVKKHEVNGVVGFGQKFSRPQNL
jgi:hypothetical protein